MQRLKSSSDYLALILLTISFNFTNILCMQSFAQKNLEQIKEIQSKEKNITPIIVLNLPENPKSTKKLTIDSDFSLHDLNEEYFELPIQDDDDSFELKELLTDLIVKNSNKVERQG